MADVDLFVDISEIIRLRFPEFSIWHLPIVVHELGHFVADKLNKESGLFTNILEEEDLGASNERMLHEQFSDFFAVNALGPAFACSCMFLTFNPSKLFEGRSGHPPDGERVHFILKSLMKIDENNPKRHFSPSIKAMNEMWQCSLKAAKIEGSLTPEQTARLDKRLDKFCAYEGVGSRLKNIRYNCDDANAPFNRWPQVSLLSAKLESQPVASILNGFGNQIILRDVLNAAWQWRLWHPGGDYKTVGQTALDLFLKIVNSGQFDV
jgi:hypothetical protein